MTDAPTFVLHIGSNKTGTSSIQSMLQANRSVLNAAGWDYPDFHQEYFAHHKLAYSIGGRTALALPDGWEDEFRQAVADTGMRYIFSSELFFRLVPPAAAAVFFPPEQTRIVLYLRDHLSYMTSWYAQAIQERNLIASFTDYVQIFQQPYMQFLAEWDAVYGRDRVTVRPFDRKELIGGDVRTDFLSQLDGVDPAALELLEADSNLTISGNLLFFKRLLNNYMTDAESRAYPITDEIGAFAELRETFRGRFSVSRDDVFMVRHLFREDVRDLSQRGVDFGPPPDEIVGNPLPNFDTVTEEFRYIKNKALETDKKFLLYANRWQDWHAL